MGLRRELFLAMGALMVLNLLLAFVAIGLFVRMGPAIERILEENVYSIEAAEAMLAELAEAGDRAVPADARARIQDALARARNNVTETEEVPVLDAIERQLEPALAGDTAARSALVGQIRGLIAINREAMNEVDADAQRLGSAGAWSAVLMGFLSFTLSLVVVGRLRHRFLAPLVELHEVLEDARHGERLRRCRAREAPAEVRQVLDSVNKLLDDRLRGSLAGKPGEPGEYGEPGDTAAEDAALIALLDRQPGPALVLDRGGRVVRASTAALEQLAGERGDQIKAALVALASTGSASNELVAIELGGGAGWLCVLAGAVSGSAPAAAPDIPARA